MMRNQTTRRAFTIIELLMAFVVMGLMLYLVDKIFFETSRAVSAGSGLNHVMLASELLSQQLELDAEQMRPPDASGTGGFLVIANKKLSAPRIRPSDVASSLRSDQLTFIYDNSSGRVLQPICPTNVDDYYSSVTAPNCRIWWGHVRRTAPNGTDTASGDDLGVVSTTNPNRLALNWILGRQALFLNGSATGIYADSAYYNADINALRYGGAGADGYPTGIQKYLYTGITDVANIDLGDAAVSGVLYSLDVAATYKTEAYKHTFISERLRVNPHPKYIPGGNYSHTYASWQMAQMHPAFLEHVTEFEVAFAGDYDADGEIDTDASNNVKWYDITNPPPDGTAGGFNDGLYTESPIYDSVSAGSDVRFVFRHDDVQRWPHLIRVRARVHDPRGDHKSYDPDTGAAIEGQRVETIIRVARN